MSVQFTWDDRYSVGIKELDEQHKRIFDLGNTIDDVGNLTQVKRTLLYLYKHTREHFDYEENLMRDAQYMKLDEHREIHNDLIENLNNLSQQIANDNFSIFEFKKVVYDWIIDHIMNHDRDFIDFYKSQNQK